MRACLPLLALVALAAPLPAADPWLELPPGDGPGRGKHIVLVSGDEEYRSEEALTQLARILSARHGFRCTVLYAIDPETGVINPNNVTNIPGLDKLASADGVVLFLRFRNLPDEQMRHFDEFLKSGKRFVAIRTTTHAFNLDGKSAYQRYTWTYNDKSNPEWAGGFGKRTLGETWHTHHGDHGSQSQRGILAESAKSHPILRGLADGDIWGPSDVYGVRLPLPGDPTPLVYGQVLAGMKPTDPPVAGKKNDPMMPIVWTRKYQIDGGKAGESLTSTIGAATDLTAEGTRRLLVNAAYWSAGLEDAIPAKSDAAIVGKFEPTPFKFGGFRKGLKPADMVQD